MDNCHDDSNDIILILIIQSQNMLTLQLGPPGPIGPFGYIYLDPPPVI